MATSDPVAVTLLPLSMCKLKYFALEPESRCGIEKIPVLSAQGLTCWAIIPNSQV